MTQTWRSDLVLLLVAAIWGFAFIAQRLGMDHLQPLTFNGIRFAVGAAALLPVAMWRRRTKPTGAGWRQDLPAGLLLGAVLCAGATLQQWGLVYTTAGKAGFITGVYVVITPVLGLLVGEHTSKRTWSGTGLALAGMYLLTMTAALTIAIGDLLVLLSAVFWAAHVICVARFAGASEPVGLACLQCATCAAFSLAGAWLFESASMPAVQQAIVPILYVGLMSTAVGYTLQVFAQQHAPPGHAAIIMSLEAVFAVVAGMYVLGESLSARGALGCGLMLAGMLLSRPATAAAHSAPDIDSGSADSG